MSDRDELARLSVEDWARREAAREYGEDNNRPTYFADGIVHAFSALLSDEAMMGAVDLLRGWGYDIGGITWRAALQAAIAAVTEGDTE